MPEAVQHQDEEFFAVAASVEVDAGPQEEQDQDQEFFHVRIR